MINEEFGLRFFAEALTTQLRQFEILDQFEIVIGDKWDIGDNRRQEFDIAIYRQDEAYAIAEFVSEVENKSKVKLVLANFIAILPVINAQFFILTNNQVYLLYDANGKQLISTSKLEEVVKFFRVVDNQQIQAEKRNKIAQAILNTAEKIFSLRESKTRNEKKNFLSWLQNQKQTLHDKIEFTGGFYYFSGFRNVDEKSFEFDFFRYLLSDSEPITEIYRYTSFDSLYYTLEGQSLRISGIAGMNDKTEAFYYDKYLDGAKKAFWEAGVSSKTIEAVNRRFILSSSLLEDDLTQWRLYGDDSKGACLVFEPKKSSKHSIVLAKISYAKRDKSHPELDFIKQFILALKRSGINFKLRYSYIWKHFFKPYDYAIEKEVRLLVLMAKSKSTLKKGWIPTNSHKILNPYVMYDINSVKLPLKLKKIVLGSKCPEKEVNRVQIKQMLTERVKFSSLNVEVGISEIDNYR